MTVITSSVETPNALTRQARYAAGKALRSHVPRISHGDWAPAADRPDPLNLLTESNQGRIEDLIPIRYGRMSRSPFNFFRGAAVIMANDLSQTPITGLKAQICGDAHLANFGIYATPERKQVFDLNDFDETLHGPWEWDVKRLAASIVIAGRQNGYTTAVNREIAIASMQAYRQMMQKLATMCHLDIWYFDINLHGIIELMNRQSRQRILKTIQTARKKTNLHTFPKMTELVEGQYRIKDEPPLIVHNQAVANMESTRGFIERYLASLPEDRKTLLSKYHLIDVAEKVVGVGSVGTICAVVLLLGNNDPQDPLFLQIKQAQASVLEPYLGSSAYTNHGHRVVVGQRLMQSASDIFLGWTRAEQADFYVRQLRDLKVSLDATTMDQKNFTSYTQACASALARAHARSGDPAQISGYMGKSDQFDLALASFAETYANQNEQDYAALLEAIKQGKIKATMDV
ncbi:MAG TPA: DUF2252 domain-containing protein [Ktedonobacteraceae bacterium]|nr:DUF2252 domain-containing protein [Ktedonobacteraceae bacterium]